MNKQLPGRNPGLIWCNSKVTRPAEVSNKEFSRWYSERHVPDVIATGLIQEAYRYVSVDLDADVQFLALYYAEDVVDLADKLKCQSRCPTIDGMSC